MNYGPLVNQSSHRLSLFSVLCSSVSEVHSLIVSRYQRQILLRFQNLCRARTLVIGLTLLVWACVGMPVQAETLIVMEARGVNLKAGAQIDGAQVLTLKEGERLTLIRSDGTVITLRGPFSKTPAPPTAVATDPKQALAALVNTRAARTSSVGVIRAGEEVLPLPEPWLVDLSRSGMRCMIEDQTVTFWRPDASQEARFTLVPSDRSYKADFIWPRGTARLPASKLEFKNEFNFFTIQQADQEFALQLMKIPRAIAEGNRVILIAWLLEKGCTQQADALLRQLGAPTP
jgi:hypothetical protein